MFTDLLTALAVGINGIPQGILALSFGFAAFPTAIAFLVGIAGSLAFNSVATISFQAETITLAVGNTNQPPILVPFPPQFGREDTTLEFTLAASDIDGDALTYAWDEMDLGKAGVGEQSAFLVSPVAGGDIAGHGVGGEEKNVSVSAGAKDDRIGGMGFHLAADQVAHHDAPRPAENVFITQGVLNRGRPGAAKDPRQGLILIEMSNGVKCVYEGAKANASALNGWATLDVAVAKSGQPEGDASMKPLFDTILSAVPPPGSSDVT